MFNLRRFVAPRSSCCCSSAVAIASTTTASLLNSMQFVGTSSNQQMNRSNNNNNRNNNNNNNYNNNNNRNYRDEQVIQATPARLSSFNRNGEPFCELSHPAESSADGFRLIVAFPTTNCTYMDIQYAPQIRDKAPVGDVSAEGKGDDKKQQRRQRLYGMPILPLTVRIYPMQMAKVVALLEGRSSEAVVSSRLAVGTFKRNAADGSVTYSIQTRTPEKVIEGNPTSAEVTLDAVHAFMLEKFLNKMLVMGYDPSRDEMPNKNRI